MNKITTANFASRVMTFIDKERGPTFGFNGSWPLTSVPFYGNPEGAPTPGGWSKNQPGVNWNHRMRHPPFTDGTPLGSNIGFLDGHVETLVNQPSPIAGEYWLKPFYGDRFVVRPEDAAQ